MQNFYPRPPRGGRPSPPSPSNSAASYFYPRPPRGGRLCQLLFGALHPEISIHALREEGDAVKLGQDTGLADFYPRPPRGGRLRAMKDSGWLDVISIHALREEGDRRRSSTRPASGRFLSTPSARRATHDALINAPHNLISIHALREEGDRHGDFAFQLDAEFLSTPSARRATPVAIGVDVQGVVISIHALREEGDSGSLNERSNRIYFYPRPPRGGRLPVSRSRSTMPEFLSTPSARRATDCQHSLLPYLTISIHALREEGDARRSAGCWTEY